MTVSSLRRYLTITTLACIATGCAVQPVQPVYSPGPYVQAPADSQEILPPLPTFTSLADCELAYGYGACGTGPQVYARASLAPPPHISYWYMPYDYALLTGALVYGHLARPTVYVSYVSYRSYVAPVYVTRYRTVTPVIVERYRTLPPRHRDVIIRQGPSHYSRSQGVMPSPRPAPAQVAPSQVTPSQVAPAQVAPARPARNQGASPPPNYRPTPPASSAQPPISRPPQAVPGRSGAGPDSQGSQPRPRRSRDSGNRGGQDSGN